MTGSTGLLLGLLISEVGISGSYLAKRHTLAHFREMWQPMVHELTNYEDWTKKGAVSPVAKAKYAASR
jgi:trimethylamine:corrinoid methyltransferase-like protein